MIRLDRILRDYSEAGALNALLSVHAAVDDHVFLTKSGDLLVVLKAHGIDDGCLDHSQRETIIQRFESAFRTLDERFRILQYLLKRDGASIPSSRHGHPVVREAVDNRLAYFRQKAVYSLETFLVVTYESGLDLAKPQPTWKGLIEYLSQRFSSDKSITILENDLRRAKELLMNRVTNFVVQLKDTVPVEILNKDKAFRFMRRLLNYAPHKADLSLKYDHDVDFQLCDSAIECHRDHLRLDDYYVQVLTLKDPPSQTRAHMFALEALPSNCVIVADWKRESMQVVRRTIHSSRRHHHNSKKSLVGELNASNKSDGLVDDGAVAVVQQLGRAIEEIEMNGRSFGHFTLSVILYDQDHARLKRSVAECFKVFATQGAQIVEERYNLLNAFLATLPGNRFYDLRAMWLLDRNAADLALLFKPDPGETANTHLKDEYLAVLETDHGTPYFLNLHYQDVAHTLVTGATGSGKSFFLNFLLTHLQKYAPRTIIFDLGGSYENLTRLFGGAYVRMRCGNSSIAMNPFSLPFTKDNLQFQFSLVSFLIESGDYAMTSPDESDLYEQIENVYALDRSQRRLSTLANTLNRNLRTALQKWLQGGPYGSFFDHVEDTVTFERFQTFDFEGMDQNPQALEAVLFYILHRASACIGDPAETTVFKTLVIDEGWRFLNHPTTKRYVLEAFKTWRKKNAAVILATQSGDDLLRSEMLAVAVESCPTKIFLANPDLNRQAYQETFHLNESETERIAGLIPKRQMLIKHPDRATVVNLNVDPKSYWIYTNDPYDREKQRLAFERHGFEEGLQVLAKERSS